MFLLVALLGLVSEAVQIQTVGTSESLECPNGYRYRARSFAFYPLADGSSKDADGNHLMTLQNFLNNKTTFVTLALDAAVPIPMGTPVCIPEFNRKFRRNIVFQYRDTADDLKDKMFTMCAVCVQDQYAAHTVIVNQYITLVIPRVARFNETASNTDAT